jgi:hypothetical protein
MQELKNIEYRITQILVFGGVYFLTRHSFVEQFGGGFLHDYPLDNDTPR